MKNYQIKPSAKFAERTLLKISEAHEHRMMVTKIMFVFCLFTPIILREVWFFARHDYFSITRWPFGSYVSSTYHLLISGQAAMYMLGLAVISAFMYLWGIRFLMPSFKFIGHFFTRGQQARA